MTEDFRQNDLFQKFFRRAQTHLQEEVAAHLETFAEFAFDPSLADVYQGGRSAAPFESPLEAGFYLWWHAVSTGKHLLWNYWEFHLGLERQPPVICGDKTYRLDFRVVPDSDDPHIGTKAQGKHGVALPCVGVELDGHEFHEKTKEQVTYRNQRDRDLQQAGWLVFHFSGFELVRHPQRCVEEVYMAASSRYFDFASALTQARNATGPTT